MSRMSFRAAGLVCLVAVWACSDDGPPVGAASVMALTDSDDVVRVVLSVSADDIDPPIVVELVQVEGSWAGIIEGIPAGVDRSFRVEGFDMNGGLIYLGLASEVTVEAGRRTNVAITLQETNPEPAFENQVPIIDSMVSSAASVGPNQEVNLMVAAHDPDVADDLTYSWRADGGSFAPSDTPSTTWTAPLAAGTFRLEISVDDGRGGQRTLGLNIQVAEQFESGDVGITTRFNNSPREVRISANPAKVAPGQSLTLDAAALDDDGDILTWEWSDSCGGHFSDPRIEDPQWTAPGTSPADDRCTLRADVRDGRGGTNYGRVTIEIGEPDEFNTAPTVVRTFQSADVVGTNGSVVFRVTGSDPDGDAISFGWHASAGSLVEGVDEEDTSQIRWRAGGTSASVMVQCEISDNRGAVTVKSFTVNVH